MKITRRQLRRIIRESVAMDRGVELTDGNVTEEAISAAWPDKVYHNGSSVFETFYSKSAMDAIWNFVNQSGYDDGQESYLGYDQESDSFMMGFDAFAEAYDEYGNSDNDGIMDGLIVQLNTHGEPVHVVGSYPGGMYPTGLRMLKATIPGIINVRLD